MPTGGAPNDSGRVTTREFFNAQLDTNAKIAATNTEIAEMDARQSEERAAMERRLLEKLNGVPTQIKTNKDEIDKLRVKSYMGDGIVTTISLFAAYLSGYLRGE